jgi:hypothetical protein
MLAPESEMLLGAVNVSVPPQMDMPPLTTVTPAGKESVKPTPVSAVPTFVLLIVKVREVVWLTRMVDGLNDDDVLGGDCARTGAA